MLALQDIDIKVYPGEVHCLLGDNGAGKSTLIKVLSGVHRPTKGEILVDGKPVTFRSPRDAQDLGVATVFQDLGMISLMSITRNFFLGREPTRSSLPFSRIDKERANTHRPPGDGRYRHRRARPDAGRRHAVGRRAAVGGDRARRPFRRARC